MLRLFSTARLATCLLRTRTSLPRTAAAGDDGETAAAANVAAGCAYLLSVHSTVVATAAAGLGAGARLHPPLATMAARTDTKGLTVAVVRALVRVAEMCVDDVQLNAAVGYAAGVTRPAQAVVVGSLPLEGTGESTRRSGPSEVWCRGHLREPFVHLRGDAAVRGDGGEE